NGIAAKVDPLHTGREDEDLVGEPGTSQLLDIGGSDLDRDIGYAAAPDRGIRPAVAKEVRPGGRLHQCEESPNQTIVGEGGHLVEPSVDGRPGALGGGAAAVRAIRHRLEPGHEVVDEQTREIRVVREGSRGPEP